MPKLPGVAHLRAVRALEKAGVRIAREGKHIVTTGGNRILTIPRHNPVNAFTMAGIVRDAAYHRAVQEVVVSATGRPATALVRAG